MTNTLKFCTSDEILSDLVTLNRQLKCPKTVVPFRPVCDTKFKH